MQFDMKMKYLTCIQSQKLTSNQHLNLKLHLFQLDVDYCANLEPTTIDNKLKTWSLSLSLLLQLI